MYINLSKVILKAFKVKIFSPGTVEMGAQINECFTCIIIMLSFEICTGNNYFISQKPCSNFLYTNMKTWYPKQLSYKK